VIDDRRTSLALPTSQRCPSNGPALPLLARCRELRHDLTIYDAAYVTLTEVLKVSLLSARWPARVVR
jgi:hypothetical protein